MVSARRFFLTALRWTPSLAVRRRPGLRAALWPAVSVLLTSLGPVSGGVASAGPVAASSPDPASEPEAARIGAIRFEGNRSFGDHGLLSWMELQPSRIFHRRTFDARLFRSDLDRLREFYREEGFLEARVDGAVDSSRIGVGQVDLRIRVEEGPRWTLSEVELRFWSQESLPPPLRGSIYRTLELSPDDPFRLRVLPRQRALLFQQLANYGYLDAQVFVEANRRDAEHTARLRYTVVPGEVDTVRDVRLVGLRKTRPEVVLRELELGPGDPFLSGKVARSQVALRRTGLFKSVEIEPSPADSGRAEKEMIVHIAERKTGDLGLGFGYGTVERLHLLASVEQSNFQGRGIRLELNGNLGTRRRGVDAVAVFPWTFGWRLMTRISPGYRIDSPKSYTAERLRGEISFARGLGADWKSDLGYRIERVVLVGRRAAGSGPDRTRIGQLTASLTRDTRDDLLLPSRGSYLRLSQAWIAPWLGSDQHFGRTRARFATYRPLLGPLTGSLRVLGGWLAPQASGKHIPISERFFAGGRETIRGFPEDGVGAADSLGVPLGGRLLATGGAELALAVSRPLQLAVFADAGQLVDHWEDFGLRRLAVGVGPGLRLRSSLGRFQLDLGVPVTRDYADGLQLHFATSASIF